MAHTGLRNALRQMHVSAREIGPIRPAHVAVQDAHQVHDGIAPLHHAIERGIVVDVSLKQRDGGK